MKKLIFAILLIVVSVSVQAQRIDTVSVYSKKMYRNIKNIVILPAGYNDSEVYPVIYLLHGHGGNYGTWLGSIKKDLPYISGKYKIIFVCPDGENSWYWDSPVNPKSQFETYISKELVSHIDSNYRTISSPKGRAVTGFSMGGHGGLWLAFRHPDIFGACGSISGGADIRPFFNNWNIKDLLGKYNDNRNIWNKHTVITQVDKIKPGSLAIAIDCGTDDFFYGVNQALHNELMKRGIHHDYTTRPGGHNYTYCNNAIDYQVLFFSKFFSKQ